jgi:tRNA(Ile)-lysidine synthetase-like protein
MKIQVKPGKYVLAVSGGVDSVVLLELLSKINGIELAVAHFDHGIRKNSIADRIFVEELSMKYNLPFYFEEGKLGPDASEADARNARYSFLSKVKNKFNAVAIITAHHQDDVIETAIINMLRGTKAKGLSALKSTDELIRPLLDVSKQKIIAYAKSHNLEWQEDESNEDQKYLRNYVRHTIAKKMTEQQREELLSIIKSTSLISDETAGIIKNILPINKQIKRAEFINLPHSVAGEFLAGWIKSEGLMVDKKTIERLVVALKTVKSGAKLNINKNCWFLLSNDTIKLQK